MLKYDPAVLQTFARRLYVRANGIILGWTLIGFIAGTVSGLVIESTVEIGGGVIVGIAIILGGLIGLLVGSNRAFLLKLQAQQALCQVQIEMNTRPRSEAAPPPR